jgi:hypothetical protein
LKEDSFCTGSRASSRPFSDSLPQLIRDHLHEAGHHGKVARKKPWVSPENQNPLSSGPESIEKSCRPSETGPVDPKKAKFDLTKLNGIV